MKLSSRSGITGWVPFGGGFSTLCVAQVTELLAEQLILCFEVAIIPQSIL